MKNKDSEVLFEYLKNVLYKSEDAHLSLNELSPEFVKLGEGLIFLNESIKELRDCTAALSKGHLSDFNPSRGNPLCDNLKNIHANLEHLTWQATQVAKGDYSQHVSYLGDFSKAFNTMTLQLKDRENRLKEEMRLVRENTQTIERYNRLFLEIIKYSDDDIFVTDVDMENILYSSDDIENDQLYHNILLKFKSEILDCKNNQWQWECQLEGNNWYSIVSFISEWDGKKAYAHYVHDISKDKHKENDLLQASIYDPLTKIYNRYYFENALNKMLDSSEEFVFCFCDLDRLKYVNDNFGHLAGDKYILSFVSAVEENCEPALFARLGGDEFGLVFKNDIKYVDGLMNNILTNFEKECTYKYTGFSYGLVSVENNNYQKLDKLLEDSDVLMYENKKIRHALRVE